MKSRYNNIKEFMKDLLSEIGIDGRPKVAVLGALYSGFDGVSRVMESQAKELSEFCDVTIYTMQADMKPPDGVKLRVIWAPKKLFVNRIYRLILPINPLTLKYIRELKDYDVLIVHHYPLSYFAYLCKKLYDVVYVQWHHHIPTECYESAIHKIYMKFIEYFEEKSFIIKNADCICSISEFSKKLLLERGGIDSIVVYNSVDDRFKEGLDGSWVRQKLGIGSDPMILFVGRIHPQKNVHTLIEVFNLVKKELKNAKLVIVGKPIFDDYFEKVKAMCDESVIFVGYVSDDELPYYYAACDVYVTCSLSESFNLPIVEAQRCGKPVVAFDIPVHREVVRKGYLIEPGDLQAFKDAIIRILGGC